MILQLITNSKYQSITQLSREFNITKSKLATMFKNQKTTVSKTAAEKRLFKKYSPWLQFEGEIPVAVIEQYKKDIANLKIKNKMKITAKTANILLLVQIMVAVGALVFLVSSCGSRSKEVNKHQVVEQQKSSSDSVGSSQTKAVLKKQLDTAVNQVEKASELEYEGQQGDSLTVTETDSSGKVVKQTTYKGKGKLKTKDTHKTTNQTSRQNSSVQNEVNSESRVKKDLTQPKDERGKVVSKKKENSFFGIEFWISIWFIIGAVLLYLDYNYNWLSRVTTLFKK